MEPTEVKKAQKSLKKATTSTVRVSPETRKLIFTELAKLNRKPHGRQVKFDDLIQKLLPRLSDQDRKELQEASLSGKDRFEQKFKMYCARFGAITRDEFLALMAEQELPPVANSKDSKMPSQNSAISEGKTAS